MSQTNFLQLQAGVDIPFLAAAVTIHNPTIKEIGLIGEDSFYLGCQMLNFSKDNLNDEDKTRLTDKSNFEVLLSVIRDKNSAVAKSRMSVFMLLSLIFPTYEVKLFEDRFGLIQNDTEIGSLNNGNFETFKQIMNEMFCLREVEGNAKEYNPGGKMAAALAQKFKKARQKKAQTPGREGKPVSILNRYISILTVGQGKDMNSLLQLTVYQLFDEFHRYEKKVAYDIWLEAKLAGAKDLKDVEHWMDDVHDNTSM